MIPELAEYLTNTVSVMLDLRAGKGWNILMKGMTLEAVTQAVKGIYTGPEEAKKSELSSITIDSRQVEKDGLFVAIKGARVDGNTFVPGAYEDGAVCCMSTEPPKDETRPYIQVESCEQDST